MLLRPKHSPRVHVVLHKLWVYDPIHVRVYHILQRDDRVSHIVRDIHLEEENFRHLKLYDLITSDEYVVRQRQFIEIQCDIRVFKHRLRDLKQDRLGRSWNFRVNLSSIARESDRIKSEFSKLYAFEPQYCWFKPELASDAPCYRTTSHADMSVKLNVVHCKWSICVHYQESIRLRKTLEAYCDLP